jgi:hypothetical protein
MLSSKTWLWPVFYNLNPAFLWKHTFFIWSRQRCVFSRDLSGRDRAAIRGGVGEGQAAGDRRACWERLSGLIRRPASPQGPLRFFLPHPPTPPPHSQARSPRQGVLGKVSYSSISEKYSALAKHIQHWRKICSVGQNYAAFDTNMLISSKNMGIKLLHRCWVIYIYIYIYIYHTKS